MPPRHPPYPYVEAVAAQLSDEEIQELIDDFLSQTPGVDPTDGCPLDPICQALNVDVEYSYEPNEILLDVPLHGKPVIWLPRKSRPRQDRVTLAMGIGHWLMHVPPSWEEHPGCGIQALHKAADPLASQEALRFALALLMPPLAFKSLWYEGGGKHAADVLNVPTQLVYERAKILVLDGPKPQAAPPSNDDALIDPTQLYRKR